MAKQVISYCRRRTAPNFCPAISWELKLFDILHFDLILPKIHFCQKVPTSVSVAQI
jgi:hypothetical protein